MAGGGILDIDGTRREQRAGQRAVELIESRRVLQWFAGKLRGGGGEGIDAEKGDGGQVVPLHQRDGLRFAEGRLPAVEQPVRMGQGDGRGQIRPLRLTSSCAR